LAELLSKESKASSVSKNVEIDDYDPEQFIGSTQVTFKDIHFLFKCLFKNLCPFDLG